MNLHASAASQRIMEDGSIWVEIRRNPEDASASHWLRALLPLSEAGLLPSDLKDREAMEHYERLVAMIKNAPSKPPRLLMELAPMRPGPIEKAFRAPKRLGLKAVRWIDRRLLKYLEAGRCRPSRPVSPQDHRGARQEPD